VIIETARLRLRPLTIGDLEEFAALHEDAEVTRYITPLDRAAAQKRLEQIEQEWRERGPGICGVFERESGQLVGRTGLKYWPQFGETEIGWVLRQEVWGRGYATEAARACVAWGFENLTVPYLTSMIVPGNDRSFQVARRLGMRPLRSDIVVGVPVEVMALHRG
jgi:RimJ/RimL family protein N-acetyltransferase